MQLSETDELTSLLNRRGLLTGVRNVLDAAGSALSAVVVLVDVDDLKGINAAHEYAAGNRAIRQVAATIRASSPPGTVIGRWGGDEFATRKPARRRTSRRGAQQNRCVRIVGSLLHQCRP
ncbi:diguanylate cyclase [Tsukamurella sputi]|uniref:Diguanylate cyclase n=1 Tax=Tsukamurella sputi TaxID=2591848 RepID=A0A5C5RL15_9ACTN|nr:diguanylate cyclase [Tsukamurella sputi]